MSQPRLANATPTLTLLKPGTAGPSLLVDAPVSLSWELWTRRLERLLQNACGELERRERRARQVSVSVELADGRSRRRTLVLPRPTDHAEEILPAALGLLRLLVAEYPGQVSRISLRFGELVEGANQPIRFERYLARRRPKGLARLAGMVASIACFAGL